MTQKTLSRLRRNDRNLIFWSSLYNFMVLVKNGCRNRFCSIKFQNNFKTDLPITDIFQCLEPMGLVVNCFLSLLLSSNFSQTVLYMIGH